MTARDLNIPLPTIDKDAAACMLTLSTALKGLASLCQPESVRADEQLNLLLRSELAGVFELLGDYAKAAREALPEEMR